MILVLALLVLNGQFQLEADTYEVRKWQRFLLVERQDQTRGALSNARLFVPAFRQIFREEGVPEDLLWLALIESSFRHDAKSPTSARGMFQFKRDTARAFGLKVRGNLDERLVPHKAARASARYLRYLYEKFDSWDLVLAAYNLGEGDLRRTMQRKGLRTWDEVRPHVREETRNYVGKVKAAALIGNAFIDSHEEAELAVEPERRHQVKRGESLWGIARRYGVSLETLRYINSIPGNNIVVGQTLIIPTETP